MSIYRYTALGVAFAGAALAAAIASGVRAERQPAEGVYKPDQGIIESFGSKHAVGYFAPKDGACAMTLFLAETAPEGESVPSAARVKLTVKPGDRAELGAVEGQSIELVCGTNAATVEVHRGSFKAAYVTQ